MLKVWEVMLFLRKNNFYYLNKNDFLINVFIGIYSKGKIKWIRKN